MTIGTTIIYNNGGQGGEKCGTENKRAASLFELNYWRIKQIPFNEDNDAVVAGASN